jgi:hypothetical protein
MKKRAAIVTAVTTGFLMVLTPGTSLHADDRPGAAAVASAQKTSDLMLATLFAALGQEFAETTPDNVAEGKKSISLIFNDRNKDMRLVGILNPLRVNDIPQDFFEGVALYRAMQGQNHTDVDRVDGKWYYRRSVALSNFHPACGMCHTNFGPVNAQQWVGALMLRVPVGGID